MMLVRILLYLAIAWCLLKAAGLVLRWWLKRRVTRFMEKMAQNAMNFSGQPQGNPDAQSGLDEPMMTSCSHCGAFFRETDGVRAKGLVFCSEDHAKAS